MSWFKLNVNDSLSSLKGQITNVSNAVQDAFAEGILDEEGANRDTDDSNQITAEIVETANRKIDELSALCGSQENEIITLRRLIAEYEEGRNIDPNIPGSSAVKSTHSDKNAGKTLEDSWFWDSEKSPSSASSKDNEHSSANNLIGVSLLEDDKNATIGNVERLRRTIDEKNDEIKRLEACASEKEKKIKELQNANNEINLQIEELDQQHTDAINGLLNVKNELQAKCTLLEADLTTYRSEQIVSSDHLRDLGQKYDDLLQSNEELIKKYDRAEASYVKAMQDQEILSNEKYDLNLELDRRLLEVNELTLALEEREREAIEKFEIVEMDKDKLQSDGQSSQLDDQCKMSTSEESKDRCDSSASMISMEEQIMQLRAESDTLVEELKIAREATRNAEDLKISYEALNAEKERLEEEFGSLKEENQRLNSNLQESNELLNVEKQSKDEAMATLAEKRSELQSKINNDLSSSTTLQAELAELKEAYSTLKTEASDLESKLLQENMLSQKQVIDLQSALNNRNIESNSEEVISLSELRTMLNQLMNYTAPINITTIRPFVKEYTRSMKSTYLQLKEIESNRDDLMKQFENVSSEKLNLQQSNETLKNDLQHCESEVAELMKNNEILLIELENAKAGKLEPISEHNEDSIVDLEKQLEDVSTLNQSLEDEYKNLRLKMDENEEEKYELLEKLEQLELQYDEQSEHIDTLKKQVEELETDKSNILFELDEFKTDNLRTGTVPELDTKIAEHHSQVEALKQEIDEIKSENIELNEKINRLKVENDASRMESEKQVEHHLQIKLNEIGALLATSENKCHQQIEEIAIKEKKITELQQVIAENDSQVTINNLNEAVSILNNEKQELVAAVQQKHNESVEYHAQIQQLHQLLNTQMQNLTAVQQQQQAPCQNCTQLTDQLKSATSEAIKLNDQIAFLREKSDILMGNLMTEQNNQKILSEEKIEILEKNNALSKELTRLREHLIEMENAHTVEMLELQNFVDQTKHQMGVMLEETKKSNTAYTSASIRANQHTETLQAQYAVLQQQRDEIAKKLSAVEDREQKNQAALINLQCALEQFQKDKERDVDAMNHRIRKELEDEKKNSLKILHDMETLQNQLAEYQNGLWAAARISDELEQSDLTNSSLREELRKTQEELVVLGQKLQDNETSQGDRVDKNLLKNLLIGFVVAQNNDKTQILKLLSSVLDFNQSESDKVGLNKGHGGWLNSILQGGANSQNNNYNKEGLAQAFVKFLEQESQPRTESSGVPMLLNIVHSTASQSTHSSNAVTVTTSASATTVNNPVNSTLPLYPAQPILYGDTVISPMRNSSSILKDILSDS